MIEEKSEPTVQVAELALRVSRVFDAPRPLVFEACSKPEHVDRWWAPRGFTMPGSRRDFREGGAWHCLMISPRGERCPASGVFEKIVPNELIVLTQGWEGDDGKAEHFTRITMRFEDAGPGRTKLTVEQATFKSVPSRDLHIGGWTECLENLGELVEAENPAL
jgi:uncharacterized protein YndB with AHSA1/START domain